jgi:hypothetical protein
MKRFLGRGFGKSREVIEGDPPPIGRHVGRDFASDVPSIEFCGSTLGDTPECTRQYGLLPEFSLDGR